MGNKANDTPKNNKPKEQMELKLLLKKSVIYSIKNAKVPSINAPVIQLFGTMACKITLSYNVGIHIWTNDVYHLYKFSYLGKQQYLFCFYKLTNRKNNAGLQI